MEEIIDFIVNEGIAVVCVAYLIYFQSTTDITRTRRKYTIIKYKS